MEEIEKEISKVAERILKAFPDLKEKINPEPYHFIEICIIFSEYCEDLTISKDDFLAANKIFSDEDDSEDINNSKEEMFTKLYNFISGDKTGDNIQIPLFSLWRLLSFRVPPDRRHADRLCGPPRVVRGLCHLLRRLLL